MTIEILTTELVPLAQLHQFEGNANRGDVDAIKTSMTAGQWRAIVVNHGSLTGRPNEILAGNHTAQAAEQLGWTRILAHWVDVDHPTAIRINVADNQLAARATTDDTALAHLLTQLPTLEATGYDPTDLENLLARLPKTPPDPPEPDPTPTGQTWGVLIMATDETQQTALLTRFVNEGLNVRATYRNTPGGHWRTPRPTRTSNNDQT